jgi:malonyl-CoA O-methyltransferase
MTMLPAAQGYALWAPTYTAETVVSALEAATVSSFGLSLAGRRVLDAGCGVGRRLHDARESGAATALGVDLTPKMLAQALGERLVAAADVRALPVADRAFDVVWCRLVLGHLPALEQAYAELARVCAPGGTVLVTDFHPAAVAAGHRRTFRDAHGVAHVLEHHVHHAHDHRAAAQRAGLTFRAQRDRAVGASIRGHYARADRLDMYEQQRGLPLVLALAFEREP